MLSIDSFFFRYSRWLGYFNSWRATHNVVRVAMAVNVAGTVPVNPQDRSSLLIAQDPIEKTTFGEKEEVIHESVSARCKDKSND